MNLPSKKIV